MDKNLISQMVVLRVTGRLKCLKYVYGGLSIGFLRLAAQYEASP